MSVLPPSAVRSSIHFCRIEKHPPPLHLFTCPGKSATCAISSPLYLRLGLAAASRCSLLFFYRGKEGGRGNWLPHHRRWLLTCLLACPSGISAEKVRRCGTGGRNAFWPIPLVKKGGRAYLVELPLSRHVTGAIGRFNSIVSLSPLSSRRIEFHKYPPSYLPLADLSTVSDWILPLNLIHRTV